MKNEKMFDAITNIRDDIVEEAAEHKFAKRPASSHWKRWTALAACLCVILGAVGVGGLMFGPKGASDSAAPASPPQSVSDEASNGSEPPPDGGAVGGMGGMGGGTFMSYAGPILPLTAPDGAPGITAERLTNYDFAGFDGGSVAVTDSYVLTNTTDSDITLSLAYPCAGSFDAPGVTGVYTDGGPAETRLCYGAYAGGFRNAGGDSEGDWNLQEPGSWEEFETLLEDGSYMASALEEKTPAQIPVTVYEFTESASEDPGQADTIAVSFGAVGEDTVILTSGFNGLGVSPETGRLTYSYFIRENAGDKTRYLIFVGGGAPEIEIKGYENGACETEKEGVTARVERRDTDLYSLVEEIISSGGYCQAEYGGASIPPGIYTDAVMEHLLEYGLLSDNPRERYDDGWLDNIIREVRYHKRVLYTLFTVTVPAGESVSVEVALEKEASYDFYTGEENAGVYGFDLATLLGSRLEFTGQKASISNYEGVELAENSFGFQTEKGADSAPLDISAEHYYLQVRVKPE